MSRRFIESFFPSTATLLRHFVPNLVEHYFPHDLDEQCPEVVLEFNNDNMPGQKIIRNPVLAIWIVGGILVGSIGCYRQWQNRRQFAWAMAFGSFAGMNVVALPLHCLLPRHNVSPLAYPLWWTLDCLFTGISSVYLCQGALSILLSMPPRVNYTPVLLVDKVMRRRLLRHVTTVGYLLIFTALCASCFLNFSVVQALTGQSSATTSTIDNSQWFKEPLWVEWTYLGPLVTALLLCPPAVVATLWQAWQNYPNHAQEWTRLWGPVTVMAIGLALGALGVLRVAWFCQHYHPQPLWLDALSAPSLVFCGCDVAFAGLHFWLQALQHSDANNVQDDSHANGYAKSKHS